MSGPTPAGGSPWPPFAPTDEGELRREVRRFAQERELTHLARELDEHPRFPWEVYRALGAQGWLGPRQAEAEGGRGWPLLREAALLEELAYRGGSVMAKLALQPDFCSVLAQASPAIRDRWFRPLFRGEVLVGNQVTEPGRGSDATHLQLSAERVGGPDGGFLLTGTKSQIAFAADAQAALVYARTGEGEGARGISAFLVPQDLPGISVTLYEDLGERWMRRGDVHYERVRVPEENLVGEPGRGFAYLRRELTEERALLAVIYLALARASLDEVAEAVMHRQVFGRPLGSFEAISFPLVEDLARWESAHLYVRETLSLLQAGEGGAGGRAALAKWLSNETSLAILDHAMQFTGGEGYSHRLPHEQRWRDVRSGGVAHGSNEILHLVAAREYLGRGSSPYGPWPPAR
jgi:cyclohexanecarboxyl-CoA dehydrogenase